MSDAKYPCENCGRLRTKEEGGTIFAVCDICWSSKSTTDAAERLRLKALNAELVKALEVIDLKTSDFTHYSHNDECRRSTDCDEADEDHHCITHWHELDDTSPRDCPSCECGITAINESNAIARAVLVKARATP